MTHQKKPDGELLDHHYDGIQELDNPLPTWWVSLFYLTIAFAIVYIGYFHFGPGLSIQEAFAKDMSHGKPSAPAQALAVIPEGPDFVQKGQVIFGSKCASCHGAEGGGLIGPNLTDNAWIHGKGSIRDLYEVIRKGVPEKGMLAWETMLSPQEIAAAANYVRSLKGSHPSNAKPPQGELVN